MPMIKGFLNVYRSGFWHTSNKPGAFDRHAGDLYPTYEAALAAIEQPQLYVDTVPVIWEEHVIIAANPGIPVQAEVLTERRVLAEQEWVQSQQERRNA